MRASEQGRDGAMAMVDIGTSQDRPNLRLPGAISVPSEFFSRDDTSVVISTGFQPTARKPIPKLRSSISVTASTSALNSGLEANTIDGWLRRAFSLYHIFACA